LEKTVTYTIEPSKPNLENEIEDIKAILLSKLKEAKKIKSNIKVINSAYLEFYDKNQSEIGHYFRSLYNIAKFVHNSEIEDKRLYSNLLRAQLSVNEMSLIFYNCLSDFGSEKFKPLIEEYSLLKGVTGNMSINPEHKKTLC